MCRRTDTACGAIFKWDDFAILAFIGTRTTNIDGQHDSRSTKYFCCLPSAGSLSRDKTAIKRAYFEY
eukprot:scaffold248503_cov50-Cyclotella_meneghiniana.AAC.2